MRGLKILNHEAYVIYVICKVIMRLALHSKFAEISVRMFAIYLSFCQKCIRYVRAFGVS